MKSFVRSIVPIAVATLVAMHFFSAAAAAQSADLSVQKYTFADPAAADANFTYFMDVFSEGPDDAQNVVLTDVLPPGVTFVSADSFPAGLPCTFDAPSHRLRCELGTLVAYDAAFIQMTVRAPSTPGTIVNTATVSSSTPDPNPDNNSSTASTEVVRFNLSDLKVTVTASANPVLVHRAVTFTTTVTNLGPHAAAGVQLSLSPPFLADILSVTPSQGTCTTTTDSIDCALGAMAIGASATLTLEVKPQTDGFALTTAFVSGYGDPLFFDPNSDNDFASVSVDVNYPGNADPALTQTSHQTIPYAALVENTCSGDIIYLSGTVREVNDDLPENTELVNEDPYGDGWMVKIEISDPTDLDELLTAAEYELYVAEQRE